MNIIYNITSIIFFFYTKSIRLSLKMFLHQFGKKILISHGSQLEKKIEQNIGHAGIVSYF